MPITHQWDNEEAGIYVLEVSAADWTWAELTVAVREVYEILGSNKRKVHFVLCFDGSLPKGNILANLRVIGSGQPSNLRHTVFVNAGHFLIRLVESFDKANKWEGPKFVDTLEEARAYLAVQDRQESTSPPS